PEPDPDRPPKDPCAGQTWVWMPDIAVQLNTGEACPSEADLKRIEQGLGGNLSRFELPDPDVRVRCENGNIFIRIWGNRVQPDSCSELARKRAQVPDLVEGGLGLGLFVNSSLIRRLAHDAFQKAPKRFGASGYPDPNGPLHLTGLSLVFKAPNIIETYISGYDERPWPDVYFTKTLIDHLQAFQMCTTEDKTDYSVVSQIVAALVLGVFSVALPILLPVTAFVLFGDIDAAINQPDAELQGGAGCRLLQTLPVEIPLPQTGGILPPLPIGSMARRSAARVRVPNGIRPKKQKLVLTYGQPAVNDGGLFVKALVERQDRVPSAHVTGPTTLSVYSTAAETFGNYIAYADDFFGNLTYRWSAGPNVVIHSPAQQGTKISFRRGNAQPGSSFERTFSVRVTDQEGSSVTVSRTVLIYVSEPDELPPICRAKPWLPQCQPGGTA
ncbi:MAG: hypothetical protein ACJ8KO_02325, partial [Sulfurifustaceae bacterium]